MRCLIESIPAPISPESLVERLRGEPGLGLLRSSLNDAAQGRYSFVVVRPFLSFRSAGSRCELISEGQVDIHYGDPWRLLEILMARYELADEFDLPFPLGGCFGYWGYELKNFVEPRLPQRAVNDLEMPDCYLGFYDSLVAFDHQLGSSWIIATGLSRDGSREASRAKEQLSFWQKHLAACAGENSNDDVSELEQHDSSPLRGELSGQVHKVLESAVAPGIRSNFTREEFLNRVLRAKRYIEQGDIYQINLSQRLSAVCPVSAWTFFQRLSDLSPSTFAAYFDRGDFQLVSSSPELFLRLSGSQVRTRPIKGTRPRAADPTRDMQLGYQLQTSAKEMAELVMITDLLRNDLGRVCQFGSINVPELARLERYAQVQHLVSTVEGSLRDDVTHLAALAACFPGGSITGAPKVRAMELIDELEPVCRGPYTGALGYLGFNRESQVSIVIRTMLLKAGIAYFQVGAGIVADSDPEAEYLETLAKAGGFFEALQPGTPFYDRPSQRRIRS